MQPLTLGCFHLALVPPTANDIEAITVACQDPEIPRWTGSVPTPYTEEDALYYVESIAWPGWESGTKLVWAVHVQDTVPEREPDEMLGVPADAQDQNALRECSGRFAGLIALDNVTEHSAEIGYWSAPGARGRGYMLGACRIVLDFAFTSPEGNAASRPEPDAGGLGLHRISWRAMVGNVPSAKLARKLGFRYEGRLRDAFRAVDGRIMDCWQAGLLAGDDRRPTAWPEEVFARPVEDASAFSNVN